MRPLLSVAGVLLAITWSSAQELPAGIPVVKSWEDLRAAPAIDLQGGVKIRLGLEAARIPQWSGVLVYCLTEGYVPSTEVKAIPGFGPVFVDFTYEGEKAACCKLRAAATTERTKGECLFVRAMPGARVGKCRVSVTDHRYKELAAADVVVTKDAFHPWTPWLEYGEKKSFPDEGVAIPAFPMAGPLAIVEASKIRTGRLPSFWPGDEASKLTIRFDGDEVVVSSDKEFMTTHPALHFIARWWVNGKPFVPKTGDSIKLFDITGQVIHEKELRLDFDFRALRLGAKIGDRIGMQVVHFENQWTYCVEPSLMESKVMTDGGHGEALVSNRIEFVVRDRHLREVKSP